MELKNLTLDDLKALKSLEILLSRVDLPTGKLHEAPGFGRAVEWFAGFVKQMANTWMAENPPEGKRPPEAPADPDAPLKVKAFNPGKVK